jgi:glycine dehydrogenase
MASSDRYEPYDFANRRHIGPSPEEMAEMLRIVGASSLEELISEAVPKAIRQERPLRCPNAACSIGCGRSPTRTAC